MIKYSGSTIEDWFYSETPINKMYYNGRVSYLKLEAEEPDYKMAAQYSDGGTALTETMIAAPTE